MKGESLSHLLNQYTPLTSPDSVWYLSCVTRDD